MPQKASSGNVKASAPPAASGNVKASAPPAASGNGAGNKVETSAQVNSGGHQSAANTRHNKTSDNERRADTTEKASSTTVDSKPATVKPATDASPAKPDA